MIRPAIERHKSKFVERKPRPLPDPLPQLSLTPVPVYCVERQALESFILKIFGWAFDVETATGQPAPIRLTYNVAGRLDSPAWEDRAVDLRCGRKTSDLQLILDTMAHDRLIPCGQYIVLSAERRSPPVSQAG